MRCSSLLRKVSTCATSLRWIPAAPTSVSEARRVALRTAASAAIQPPSELPMRWTPERSSWSRKSKLKLARSPTASSHRGGSADAPTELTGTAFNHIRARRRAGVPGAPGVIFCGAKPVPVPKKAEVLVRIDAVAICATDLEIIYHGPPALILGGMPHNKNFPPGHEYMGTVVALGPGVDEYRIGQRVTVEIHAGCGQCKRCREGMYTACHNYGLNYGDVDKGHRANGFTTDGRLCEYQVNNINNLGANPDDISDEEATLVVTAGTAMYGLTELGGLVAGESVVVTGPGPIGLLGVAVAKALGAQPVILTGTRDNRLKIGRELGADHVVNVRKENAVEAVRRPNGGPGGGSGLEIPGAAPAGDGAIHNGNPGRQNCIAAFPPQTTRALC